MLVNILYTPVMVEKDEKPNDKILSKNLPKTKRGAIG